MEKEKCCGLCGMNRGMCKLDPICECCEESKLSRKSGACLNGEHRNCDYPLEVCNCVCHKPVVAKQCCENCKNPNKYHVIDRCDDFSCICHYVKEQAKANPFYHNYLFTKADTERAPIEKRDRIRLLMYPTLVQVNDGYAFFYKIVNGAYYLIKFTKMFK